MLRRISRRQVLALALGQLVHSLKARGASEGTPPDRLPRLVEAARSEGDLLIYSSMPVDDLSAITREFEARSGVKVKTWRSSSEQVVQRAIAETRASRQGFDLVETHAGAIEVLRQAGALRPLDPPLGQKMSASLFPSHREWIGTRLSLHVCAYNTRLVPLQDVPKSYSGLAAARWKQRIAFESDDFEWFAALHTAMGEAEAGRTLNAIAANGILLRKGHSLMANLVAAGELPLALNAYGYRVAQLMKTGAPIAYQVLPPSIATLSAIGTGRMSRRANAAALFVDFLLGQGQAILAARFHVPVISLGKDDPLDPKRLVVIDPGFAVGETARLWRSRYEAFLRRGAAHG